MGKLISTLLALALFSGFLAPAAPAAAPIRSVPNTAGKAPIIGVVPAPIRGPGAQYLFDFRLTPGGVNAAFKTASANLNAKLDAIAALRPEGTTFENTVLAFETAGAEYDEVVNVVDLLGQVSPNARMRRTIEKMEEPEKLSRSDVYAAVKAFADSGRAVELEGEDQRLFEKTMRGFKKNGMDLAPAEREKFLALARRTDDLAWQYMTNLHEWEDDFDASREELKGVPARVVNGLKKGAGGKLRVNLDAAGTVNSWADSARLRRKAWFMFERQAAEKNIPILKEVLQLRQQQAELLGYKNFAEMQLDDRMAKEPKRVWAFLTRLKGLLRETSDKEDAEILARKQKDQPDATRVYPWDAGYYGRMLFEETYSIDSEKVREYFPYEHVLAETLKIYEELFGIEFREVKDAPVWHRQVKTYDIYDAGAGTRLARIYFDLFSRKGKHDITAAYSLAQGRELADGSYREPVVGVVANFTKKEPGKPALLAHGNVKDLFHELGHAVHKALTTAKHPTLAGSAVAKDFVEAMSQMMENFVWQAESIARLSKHYETGEPLPDAMRESLLASRNHHSASSTLWVVALSAMDMAYHMFAPVDVLGMYRRIMKEFTGVTPPPRYPANFMHLLGGYEAGVYGYLWARSSAQEIYSVFEAAPDGPLSPTVGARYRKVFLERGATVDEPRLMRAFLEREPNEAAFLAWLGIKK